MSSAPTITPGLDSVDAAIVELLDAILHVATRPGCTLADLTQYVADLRDGIAVTAIAENSN